MQKSIKWTLFYVTAPSSKFYLFWINNQPLIWTWDLCWFCHFFDLFLLKWANKFNFLVHFQKIFLNSVVEFLFGTIQNVFDVHFNLIFISFDHFFDIFSTYRARKTLQKLLFCSTRWRNLKLFWLCNISFIRIDIAYNVILYALKAKSVKAWV